MNAGGRTAPSPPEPASPAPPSPHERPATPHPPGPEPGPGAREPADGPDPLAETVRPLTAFLRRIRRPSPLTSAFLLMVLTVTIARFLVMWGSAPPTIDSGNWLAFAESFFGDSPRDPSITYPPVVPALAELFTSILGVNAGIAMLAALSAAAPALGMYGALGMSGVGQLRAFPALLLLGAGSIGEASAWGGFPQLIALGLLPLTLVAGLGFRDAPTRRSGLELGALFFAMAAVVGVIAIFEVDTVLFRRWPITRGHLRASLWVMVPSLPLVGVYARLVDAVLVSPNPYTELDNLSWGNLLERVDLLYREFPALWQVLIPLALATPLLTLQVRHHRAWRLSAALLVAVVNLLLLTREGRYLYLVPLVPITALGVWVVALGQGRGSSPAAQGHPDAPDEPDAPHEPHEPDDQHGALPDTRAHRLGFGAAALGLALLVLAQNVSALDRLEDQRDFYALLTPELVEAIDGADDAVAERGGIIAVPSLNDAPIGWWVEALTDDPVIYGSPLRWLNFADEIDRAQRANAIFHPTFPDADSLALLGSSDVTVVVLPRRWAWFDEAAVDDWVAAHDLDVLVANRDAVTIALP